jgi:hypothetical protein
MHGFPLTFKAIRKRMCQGKRKFGTERGALTFNVRQKMVTYLCPFCCMYHISSHGPSPRYEQEKWWIIWLKEVQRRACK